MSTVRARIDAPAQDVWDALIDVHTYPDWLIGARQIRAVDDLWPAPGTAFHHTVGVGPVTISDRTRATGLEPGRCLDLDVRAWPLLRGKVTFRLTPEDGGTEVAMEEHPVGIHRLLAPLLSPLAMARNRASLEKLRTRVRERAARLARD